MRLISQRFSRQCFIFSLHISHSNAGLGNPAYKDGTIPVVGRVPSRGDKDGTIPVVGRVPSRGGVSAFQAECEICRLALVTGHWRKR